MSRVEAIRWIVLRMIGGFISDIATPAAQFSGSCRTEVAFVNHGGYASQLECSLTPECLFLMSTCVTLEMSV